MATIGNFDGVHLGHQAVLDALTHRARGAGLPSLVITFEPQPMEFFCPEQAPARLTRLREKLEAIACCGIDRVLLIRFNAGFAGVDAKAFIREVLVGKLGIHHLYVGDDFRFGKDRAGDFALLRSMGRDHGFGVESLDTVADEGCRISSTRVREALQEGDLAHAERCLGRRYRICGRVGHGHKRGRTIGFPTMNVALLRRSTPLRGVFAVQVLGLADDSLPGVANIGNRPTLSGDHRFLLEVHLSIFPTRYTVGMSRSISSSASVTSTSSSHSTHCANRSGEMYSVQEKSIAWMIWSTDNPADAPARGAMAIHSTEFFLLPSLSP